jgi:uncharacterized membrane protein
MPPVTVRVALRWLLAVLYVGVGFLHLRIAPILVPLVPSWIPDPIAMLKFTGLCEIIGGLALLAPPTRPVAGIMLALYAICVFPANLHHAFDHVIVRGMPNSWWYHAPRLAFQPVFVWWALYAGEVIDWPGKRRTKPIRPRVLA